MGGAFMILNHFIDRLTTNNINFVLLKDFRCPKLRSEDHIKQLVVMPSGEFERIKYYKGNRKSFSAVLCLGNIPPAIKMPVPVHTYIHNVSLLLIPKDYPLFLKVKTFIKRCYISLLAKNTDSWIVQTENTENLVKCYLPDESKPVFRFPFYYIPEDINHVPYINRTDYVFVGECTKAKGHEYLIEAWTKLARMGFNKRLHLTVSDHATCLDIEKAQRSGANIINHGYGAFEKIIEYYNMSKATIYPSLNESLGLGIIEAVEAGCDVIACDLPYVHCISSPSATFKACDSDSIVNAVIEYEKNQLPRTRLLIHDMADELIDFIQNK